MSVLIKGMEMPRGCDECYIRERDTCPLLKVNVGEWGRFVGCPLVELPDHGDLIDRDKLKHGFCVECTLYPDNCLGDKCDWGSIYHIEHEPCVIPAERE